MAAKALEPSKELQNFQRVSRLLITGATTVTREIFDSIHPPATLHKLLANPKYETILKNSRMTQPQWKQVYPSPGKYGQSRDWDLTLLSKMLRNVCGLKPPLNGWDKPPAASDVSREADLVRLKNYRNEIYAHVDEKMEIRDEDFQTFWKNISQAIIRLAAHLSSAKKEEWENAIDRFLTTPLTVDEMMKEEELKSWYKDELEVKEQLREMNYLIRSMSLKKERDCNPTADTCSQPHHGQGLMEWFCEECRECLCRTCVTLSHRNHSYINMNNLVDMQILTQELLDTSEKLKNVIQKHRKQMEKIREDGALRDEVLNKIKHETQTTVETWIQSIREEEVKLMKEIDNTQKTYREKDDFQVRKIEKQIEDMATSVRYTEDLANNGSTVNKVMEKEHTMTSNNDLVHTKLNTEQKTISGGQFIPNLNLTPNIGTLGNLSLWDCVAEGEGLKSAIVGFRAQFTVSTIVVDGASRKTRYNPDLIISVKIQCKHGDVSPNIHDNKDGTYNISFIPEHNDNHQISVMVNGKEIPTCAFTVPAKQCILSGEGLERGIVGLNSQFTITFRVPADPSDHLDEPTAKFNVKIQSSQKSVTPIIQDNKDGTYNVSFIPLHPGNHKIFVTVGSYDIAGSPFIVNIKQCVLKGKGITDGTVGLKSQFSLKFDSPADEKPYDPTVILDVKISSAQSTLTPAIHDNKDGSYVVSYFPSNPGNHQVSINVRYITSENEDNQPFQRNQEGIPGSPFAVTIKQRQFETVRTFGTLGNKEGEFHYPWGVAVNDKDHIIVADFSNHRVQVFTSEGQHIRTIGRKGTEQGEFDGPKQVVTDKENNIIVLDKSCCRLHIFDENGEFRVSFGHKGKDNGQLGLPWGLSVNSEGNIVVTDTNNERVQVLSTEGKSLKSFNCGNKPWHCVAHGDYYYVSVGSPENCIKVFDKNGTFIRQYGEMPSSPRTFNCPFGLAIDKSAHLVVCETNNGRLQVLNLDGTFVSSFGKMICPSSVAVMSDGKLVVCEGGNHKIHIFE